jgi:hypothetical protein
VKRFKSCSLFAEYLLLIAAEQKRLEREGLEKASHIVETEAKALMGHYGQGWDPLKDATKEQRLKLGFPEDEPLLRNGALRDAVEASVGDGEAVVGVASAMVGDGSKANPVRDIAVVAKAQELGTDTIPARSFLGTACVQHEDAIVEAMLMPMIHALQGKPMK